MKILFQVRIFDSTSGRLLHQAFFDDFDEVVEYIANPVLLDELVVEISRKAVCVL